MQRDKQGDCDVGDVGPNPGSKDESRALSVATGERSRG